MTNHFTFASWTTFDIVICFAGLGVFYSTDESNPAGSNGFDYKKSDATSVFWEVLRVFPPVRAFSYWSRRPLCAGLNRKQTDALNKPNGKSESCPLSAVDPETGYPPVNQYKGGYHTQINLATAMNDPAVWGSDADKFRPRAVKEYEKYSVAFAEPAVDNSVANGTMNRNCPATSMAIFIGKTFLELFNKGDWFADPHNPIKLKSGGGSDTGFTLYYRHNETNCREVLCNCMANGSDKELCGSAEMQCTECLKAKNYCRF